MDKYNSAVGLGEGIEGVNGGIKGNIHNTFNNTDKYFKKNKETRLAINYSSLTLVTGISLVYSI